MRSLLMIIMCFGVISTSISQTIIVKPYLQNAEPNSLTIMWEAAENGSGSIIYGEDPFSMNSTITSQSITGSGTTKIHNVDLVSLSPQQKYYYKIIMQDGTNSSIYHFITPPEKSAEASFQIVAISDMQKDGSHPNKFNEIVEQGIIPIVLDQFGSDISDLEAILIPGDLVPNGGNYNQWGNDFFEPADSLLPYVPLYPVLGNHEYYNGGFDNFIKYFALPTNGPPSLQDEVWYKDISNTRIIGLNSNSGAADKTLQLSWLTNVLSSTCIDPDIDFVFAQLHHPYKSELWTPGNNTYTGEVIEILEQFTDTCGKSSVHFFGHTHGYSRGQSRDYEHLWVNVATAGGAIDNWGEFPNADYAEFSKSQDEYGFVILDVTAGDEPQMKLTRYSRGDQDIILNNEIRDQIILKKYEFPARKPINIFPNGQQVPASCLVLKSSTFDDYEDIHQASHWQIATDNDFTNTVVTEKWFQSENYYNEVNLQENDDLTDVADLDLINADTYYWRVRYRDQYLKWSQWSDPTTFELIINDLSGNLVKNEGADDGINNWTGDIEALENGECNSVPPFEGNHAFAVGGVCENESDAGLAYQIFDLSSYSSQINDGLLSVKFGGYMRDYSGSDLPEMYIEYYNNNSLISTSNTIENQSSIWLYKSSEVGIPVGVDECRLYLKGTRNGGNDNDSYFDKISLHIILDTDCNKCFGTSGNDMDNDGYCDDIDCDDNDPFIYPGAIEICDSKDNNCDGFSDFGNTVTWTGNGPTLDWADAANWDQNIAPLPCQHVIISLQDTVLLSGRHACKSLEIGAGNKLTIDSDSHFIINGNQENNVAATILGTMQIDGKFTLKNIDNNAIDVFGTLINNGKTFTSSVINNSITVKSGGIFINNGKIELQD